MYTLWNPAILYIMEPSAQPYMDFGACHDVIDHVMCDIIGIE